MAQTSLLHRRQSSSVPNYYCHSSQQLQLIHDTREESSTPSSQFNHFRQVHSMAQPLVQQCRQEDHLQDQQWTRQQALRQPEQSAYTGRSPNDLTYPQSSLWGTNSVYNQGFASNSALQMPPHTMTEHGGFLHRNNESIYPGSTTHELSGKAGQAYGVPWFPPRSTEIRCGMSVNGSDLDTTSSYSPKSFASEMQGSGMTPFTPESVENAANWSCYSASSYTGTKVSSPNDIAAPIEDTANLNFTGLPQYGLGTTSSSPTPAGSSHGFNGLPIIYDDTSQYDLEFSDSQKNNPGISPWYTGGQSLTLASMPYRPRNPQVSSAPINSLPTGLQARNDVNKDNTNEPVVWNSSRTNILPQHNFQDHFHSYQPPETRKEDDEILLKGKRNGLTYREISKKMHTKCAESTLRGRYRSLTKARQDRVRKPVWREKDIELLTQFTMRDLDRIDTNHYNSLSYDQKLAKVQWKKIAESISANGGSYHFGNSTCKRKWQELNPGP